MSQEKTATPTASAPKRRGGLEFIPLPAGATEDDYTISPGRRHPGQLDAFVQAETLTPDGRRKG